MSTTVEHSVKTGRAFAVEFKDIDRWGASSFREVIWGWPEDMLHPLSRGIISRIEPVGYKEPLDLVPIIGRITFGGIVTLLNSQDRYKYKGKLFWASAGDFIYSKIRAKQGSLAVVPAYLEQLAVSAEYPVFRIIDSAAIGWHFQAAYLTVSF